MLALYALTLFEGLLSLQLGVILFTGLLGRSSRGLDIIIAWDPICLMYNLEVLLVHPWSVRLYKKGLLFEYVSITTLASLTKSS